MQTPLEGLALEELLGHEDIKSTVIYTEVVDSALSEVVLRLPWNLGIRVRDNKRAYSPGFYTLVP